MCENTAADLKQLSACFGELGRVLNSLWLSGHWSASDTIAVLHEITNTPDSWLAENVACLLHSAGESHFSSSSLSRYISIVRMFIERKLCSRIFDTLTFVGPQLASLAVQHKASKGYVTELAVILTSLCLVQVYHFLYINKASGPFLFGTSFFS